MDNVTARNAAILAKCKAQFEAAASSPFFQQWQANAEEDYRFYEGEQWTEAEKQSVRDVLGIEPLTFNKILPRLNNVAGMEIQTRTKVTYRARSFDKKEKGTAEALSDLAMFVQDKNNSTHVLSAQSHDARICGLGWHDFDVQDGVILEKRQNPLMVVWDVGDMTPNLTNQSFNTKFAWWKKVEVTTKWPDKKEEIEGCTNWATGIPFDASGSSFRMATCGGYLDADTGEILVAEHTYREAATYYEVIDRANRLITTFSKSEAEDMARTKPGSKDKDITERQGFKVIIVYFTGDVLLDVLEDTYQLNPAKGLFLLTPTVCFRENTTGIPYGLVRNAKDAQRSYNKTKTRLKWMMATSQVVMEGDAADAEKVRSEAARPDGVLIVKAGRKLDINRHESAIAQCIQSLESDDKDIQSALGIYDESLGVETNANSGIAIQKRQLGSSRNMAMVIDNALAMKRHWAEKLLYLIQSVFTEQTALWVTDDAGEVKLLVLNETSVDADGNPVKDAHGNPVVKYDMKTGVFDVVVEEVPDVASQQEYARELVLQAMQTTGGLAGITPGLLELLGVPKSSKLMEEIQAGLPQQMASAQQLPTANMPTAMPRGAPTLQPITGQVQ